MANEFSTLDEALPSLTDALRNDYDGGRVIDRITPLPYPDKEIITTIIDQLKRLLFPGYFRAPTTHVLPVTQHLSGLMTATAHLLLQQLTIALRLDASPRERPSVNEYAQALTVQFLSRLPEIRALLQTDLDAFFDGDPAATSPEEIILAYPGLHAIVINRLAHLLFMLKVPFLPRIMTELAHSQTGIDIHPGASIGRHFFIDHGTGIVIGETTVIGNDVKIYQGVTLGALSTRGGQKLRGTRRHPTIEDRVTIYAGASVLGGDTVIGHDAVIGGNAFITSSIAPGTRVSLKNPELEFRSHQP